MRKEEVVSRIMSKMNDVSTDDEQKYKKSKLIRTEADLVERIVDFSMHNEEK